MTVPAVEVSGLEVHRGRRPVVNGMSFTVCPGTVIGLLGPSGSGKTMMREGVSGTLERLLSTPFHKLDLLFGYAVALATLAVVQACVATVVAYGLLGLRSQGAVPTVLVLAVATAILGSCAGLFTSVFARSEFEALQFAPDGGFSSGAAVRADLAA